MAENLDSGHKLGERLPHDARRYDTTGRQAAPSRFRVGLTRKRHLQNMLDHVSQEMYARNRELSETNKTLSLLRTIDALVLESHTSLQMVCEDITEAIVKTADYALVGLLTCSTPNSDELVLNSWHSSVWLDKQAGSGFSQPLHLRLTHRLAKLEAIKLVSLAGLSDAEVANFLGCPESDIKRIRLHLPLKSLYVVKLLARRRLVGLLVMGFLIPASEVSETDITLMNRLSETVGVALDNKLLFEENQHVLRQLRESNAKLLQANKDLQTLDALKDDFISMASHQLRSPATSVHEAIQMLEESGLSKAERTQMLSLAEASSERLVGVIADMLSMARIQAGHFTIEESEVDLAELVDRSILQASVLAKHKNVTLHFDKPKQAIKLQADRAKLNEAMSNYIENAIRYCGDSTTITVDLKQHSRHVSFEVSDEGIGVPEKERKKLFGKFYRAPNARKEEPNGNGIGLFVVKTIAEGHGGRVYYKPLHKGSLFGLWLPLKAK